MQFRLVWTMKAGEKALAEISKDFSEETRHAAIKHMLEKIIENRENNQSIKNLKIEARLFDDSELVALYAD